MASSIDTGALAARYVELALGRSPSDAVQLLIEPLVAGEIDLEMLFERVITPAAEQVGDLWYAAEISVADEHFVTQLNQQVISAAVTLSGIATRAHGNVVVLACPEGEIHDTGLRMVAALIQAHGHSVHLLGASTPTRDLVRYALTVGATDVGLSVVTPLGVPGGIAAADALRAQTPARLFVGGRAAHGHASIAESMGATFCASARDLLDFLQSPA